MVKSCCVVGCTRRYVKGTGVGFHSFPCDENRKVLWILALRRKNWTPTPYTVICGDHFQTGKPSKDENHPDFVPNVFSYSVGMKRNSHQKQREKNSLSTNQETKKVLSENFKAVSFSQSQATDLQKTYLQEKDSVKILDRQENRNVEYIYCAIPGCKSKSFKRTECSTAEGDENILMFPVPKADKFFNKWKEAIKETEVELTKDDHICKCHFFEKDIQRCYRTRTTGGDIIEIPKRQPTLKADAVPCKDLKPSLHITKDSSKKMSIFEKPIVSNSERNTTNKSSFNSFDSRNNTIDTSSNDSSLKSSADSSVNFIQEQVSPKKKCMPYNELVKNIHLIEKPSLFWTVLCTDQFTIFARWNNKFCAEKRLVIESSLTVRVFLKEWEIEMTDLVDITCIDDVSALLEKVDNYNLVPGTKILGRCLRGLYVDYINCSHRSQVL